MLAITATLPMTTLTIRLDPAALDNADVDLRYVLPDALAERSGGFLRADGYDYEDDDVMVVFLEVDAPDVRRAVGFVRDELSQQTYLGNSLADVARLAVVASARVARQVRGRGVFADVTLEVGVTPEVTGIIRGPAPAARPVTAHGLPRAALWDEGALRGASFALFALGLRTDVRLLSVGGTHADTTPSAAALAAARAVWSILDLEVPAASVALIERWAFGPNPGGMDELPFLGMDAAQGRDGEGDG